MLMDWMRKPFEIHFHPAAKGIAKDGQAEKKLDDQGKY
jgi:hypothetical protein